MVIFYGSVKLPEGNTEQLKGFHPKNRVFHHFHHQIPGTDQRHIFFSKKCRDSKEKNMGLGFYFHGRSSGSTRSTEPPGNMSELWGYLPWSEVEKQRPGPGAEAFRWEWLFSRGNDILIYCWVVWNIFYFSIYWEQ